MSKFWRDKDGKITTVALPRGYVKPARKFARVDWPTWAELVACVYILAPAVVRGLALGALWLIRRAAMRRAGR